MQIWPMISVTCFLDLVAVCGKPVGLNLLWGRLVVVVVIVVVVPYCIVCSKRFFIRHVM